MPPQVLAGFAAAEAVGAQGEQAAGNPRIDLLGHGPHVVGGRDERSFHAGELLLEITFTRRLIGVQHVPVAARLGIVPQFLVAGDAPDGAANIELLGQDFLRLLHASQNRAAAEQLHVRLALSPASTVFSLYMPRMMPSSTPVGIAGIS